MTMNTEGNVDIWTRPIQQRTIRSKFATVIMKGVGLLVVGCLVAAGFVVISEHPHGKPTSVCDGEVLAGPNCMVAEWQICKEDDGLIVLLLVFDGGPLRVTNPHWFQFNAGHRYIGEWNPKEPLTALRTRREWIGLDGRREFDGATDGSGNTFGGHFFEFRIPWVMRK